MEIKLLSIIVPIYKKEQTIVTDLQNIYNTLKGTPYNFEIIGVVDGTALDKSYENASKITLPEIKIIGYKNNKGKGQAVRFGMQNANGDVVIFIDSGMDINPSGIIMLLEHMKWYNADIIIGSKLHPASKVDYDLRRKLLTYGYLLGTKVLFSFKLKTRDTQTGLKAFKREVLEKVLDRLVVKKFAFDIEILVVAHKLGFRRIFDAPVEVSFAASKTETKSENLTKFFIDRDGFLYFVLDTLGVWYRMNILNYYSDKQKRESKFDEDLNLYVNTGNLLEPKRQRVINLTNKLMISLISSLIKNRQLPPKNG